METIEHVPGPGFAPFFVAIVMGILSIGLHIKSSLIRNNKKEHNILSSFHNIKDVLLLSAVLLVYALVLNTLGFMLSMFMLMTFLFRTQDKNGKVKRWLLPVSIGMAVTLMSYFIFSYLLECQLPKGFFGI